MASSLLIFLLLSLTIIHSLDLSMKSRVPIADVLKNAKFPPAWPYTPQDFKRQVRVISYDDIRLDHGLNRMKAGMGYFIIKQDLFIISMIVR